MDGWTDGRRDAWVGEKGEMDGWTVGRMVVRMDGESDRRKEVLSIFKLAKFGETPAASTHVMMRKRNEVRRESS